MVKSVIDRNEIRRLEKAAREKDKKHLGDWAKQLEETIRQEYEREFQLELTDAIDHFCVAIVYALHFGEKTKYGNRRCNEFMEDLFVTIDMFRTGEYNPTDYKKQLSDDGITIFDDEIPEYRKEGK